MGRPLDELKPKIITVQISGKGHMVLRYYGLMAGMKHGDVIDRALALLARESKLDQQMARSIGAFANPADFERKEKQDAPVKDKIQGIG